MITKQYLLNSLLWGYDKQVCDDWASMSVMSLSNDYTAVRYSERTYQYIAKLDIRVVKVCTSGEEYKAKESAAHDLHMHLYGGIISELMMIKDKVRFGTREDTLSRVGDLIDNLKE